MTTGFGLKLYSILRADKSAQAFNQAFKGVDVELITTTKRVDNLSLGIAFLWMTNIVGELDVLYEGSVPIFPLDGARTCLSKKHVLKRLSSKKIISRVPTILEAR